MNMKRGSKSKKTAGGGGLTTKEKRILAMARRIDRAAARIHRGLSPWFYTHGWVTLEEAGKRLGYNAKELEASTKKYDGLRVWHVKGKRKPGDVWPNGTRIVPISELRRVLENRAKGVLEKLAAQLLEILRPPLPEGKLTGRWSNLCSWRDDRATQLDILAVAERLNITPRKVRAFMNANGPLSLAASWGSSRGELVVTPAELEAFEKAHRREILKARRDAGTFAEPRIESKRAA